MGQLGLARVATAKLRHRHRTTRTRAQSRARQQRHSVSCSDCSKAVAARLRKQLAALRKSVELDPENLFAVYKLAEEVERQGDEQSTAEVQSLLQKILTAQPDNLAAQVELSRIAAKRGDADTLNSTVAKIKARSSAWPPKCRSKLQPVDETARSGDLRAAATRTSFLRNVLVRVPEYRRSLAAIKPPPGEEAVPFTHFLRLESPVFQTAAADAAIKFTPQPVPNAGATQRTQRIRLDRRDSAEW